MFCAEIYNVIKEKQMARDSHECKTVILKRLSIMEKAEDIRRTNRELRLAGRQPFNSPSGQLATLVEESPPFQRQAVNSRRLGQHQGVSSSTYAVYEDNTTWTGVTNSTTTCQTITKTTKMTLPSSSNMITEKDMRSIQSKASRVVSCMY